MFIGQETPSSQLGLFEKPRILIVNSMACMNAIYIT
jgi:hypothetical protein